MVLLSNFLMNLQNENLSRGFSIFFRYFYKRNHSLETRNKFYRLSSKGLMRNCLMNTYIADKRT